MTLMIELGFGILLGNALTILFVFVLSLVFSLLE